MTATKGQEKTLPRISIRTSDNDGSTNMCFNIDPMCFCLVAGVAFDDDNKSYLNVRFAFPLLLLLLLILQTKKEK